MYVYGNLIRSTELSIRRTTHQLLNIVVWNESGGGVGGAEMLALARVPRRFPLTANSRISCGRINPPFAKYARTIRSAMRDPEISPWQSSCFRRPRWQGSGRWPGSGCAGGVGGRGGGRRTRASVVGAGLAMRTCQEQRLASLPPPLAPSSLTCPFAFHLIRSLACRSSVSLRVLILASRRASYVWPVTLSLPYLSIWFLLVEQNGSRLRFVRVENSLAAVFLTRIVGKRRLLGKHSRLLTVSREYEGIRRLYSLGD